MVSEYISLGYIKPVKHGRVQHVRRRHTNGCDGGFPFLVIGSKGVWKYFKVFTRP